ncbi:MAG TPA: VOC family protein [Phenylobacterium sp.]|uniref:VOC family protein n=1 Tax=Phenylobacterium sp. TaxID=1871053 RepID=UPI002D1942AD|nr:VOC family protein [Phenylobacterium sp.]HSV03965.1 VOC family protein [Phenylobacterium sp.]
MTKSAVFAAVITLALGAHSASAQNPATANPAQVRVRYMVQDVPSSVAFYTEKLGFKLDMQSGRAFAAVSRGGIQLLLSPTKGPGGASQPMPNGQRPAAGGWNRLVLYTADLQGDVEKLRKQGVRFRNDIVVGLGGNEILIDDPSGNAVELFQPTLVVGQTR